MADPREQDLQLLPLLVKAAAAVPAWHYALLAWIILAFFLYRVLEFHFIEDLLSGFRGHRVLLVYNPASPIAKAVLPSCDALKERFWPTPWLCSPHLQTAFLHFFGWRPEVVYQRQLCRTPDGGTIALDWLNADYCRRNHDVISQSTNVTSHETTPTVVVIPGLTSDSSNAYIKRIVHSLSEKGWRVVVANHRGLGGVSITSNQFYNAGWTEDLRRVVNHLHQAHPKAPLLAIGTSIGANILVKYLGEEGEHTPLTAAAAICCPWDLVVCDRFICRRFIQRLYDKILAFGLRSYAQLHQVTLSRIADWDLISKAQTIRDFDNYCTRIVGHYETVDTYYRKCSSAYYLGSVAIPLFCLSSLDDPVCTKEAIPWDECKVNKNVVLGITRHGGHLAFFEGLTARSIWWVQATSEVMEILSKSIFLHKQNQVWNISAGLSPVLESVIDKSPYVNFSTKGVIGEEESSENEGGFVEQESEARSNQESPQVGQSIFTTCSTDVNNNKTSVQIKMESRDLDSKTSAICSGTVVERHHSIPKLPINESLKHTTLESAVSELIEQAEVVKHLLKRENDVSICGTVIQRKGSCNGNDDRASSGHKDDEGGGFVQNGNNQAHPAEKLNVATERHHRFMKFGPGPLMKNINAMKARNRHLLKLLAYITIVTAWPVLGSALFLYGRKRVRNLAAKYWPK